MLGRDAEALQVSGEALHLGTRSALFHFHRANVFDLTETEALQMEQFMMAFDTDLAPAVGQQITLTGSNGGTVGSRIDLLCLRARHKVCPNPDRNSIIDRTPMGDRNTVLVGLSRPLSKAADPAGPAGARRDIFRIR